MRLPASCSRAAHDPAGAAGGKVCLVEDANGGREASLEFGQRSSAPVPHHSRHLTQPQRARRARRYFSRLSGPTYAILRPAAKNRFLISISLLVDDHGGLFCSSVLGNQACVL